jgi:hypothetical protein
MPNEIDHGSDVYAKEVERIKTEKEQAAHHIAEQLVAYYKETASWRTSVDLKFPLGYNTFTGLAQKYGRITEVLLRAKQILSDRGWQFEMNNSPYKDDVQLTPLATISAKN